MFQRGSFDQKLGLLNQIKNIHFTILWKKTNQESKKVAEELPTNDRPKRQRIQNLRKNLL